VNNGPVVKLVYTLRLSRSPYGCGFESHPDYKKSLKKIWQIKNDYISL
jgi:hypothetical protein